MTHSAWNLEIFSNETEWLVEERHLGQIPLAEVQRAFSCPSEETMHGLVWRVGPTQASWLLSRGDQDLDFDFEQFTYDVLRDPGS